ncbi:MAG: hypothetical protein A2X64_05545 [Ignavibacteria bacterium GWF2_33_9]|nr:MAG: hypothetical protein A2X64_05545 [Ignavibacteria bacterium GWF2_33_9]
MVNNTKSFLNKIENLIQFAQKSGATQSQIYLLNNDDFSVEVRNGEIQELNKSISANFGIKILVDDKVATASTSDLRDETIERLILNAIKRAQYSEPDEFMRLADFITNDFDADSLEIYDPEIGTIDNNYKIAQALKLEKIAMSDNRIKVSDGAMYGTTVSEVFAANSNGLLGSFRNTSIGGGVHLLAGEDDQMFEEGWWENSIFASKMKSVEEIAAIAVNRVTRLLGAKKIDSGTMPVVMEPNVASSLFGFFASCISGGAVYMHRTFLADKLNEKIAADILNILDNGRLVGGTGTLPFDSDGTPTRLNSIVKDGVLQTYLLGTYSARKLGMKSTGNASGPTNFIISPTEKTQDDLIKSINKGILITSTIGQGTDSTTGDISKGAFGMMIENGELSHPVAEITFSGNLGNILNNIEMIADNPNTSRSVQSPAIKIGEISISGN